MAAALSVVAFLGALACGSHAPSVNGHPDGAPDGMVGTDGTVDGGAQDGGARCSSTSACAAGLVCERVGTSACLDPIWAEWPMPNAAIEVMAGASNPQSYSDNNDGTVTDDVTKLVWQQLTPPTDFTQAEAMAYCAGLDLGGTTDWRLPALIELISIVDTGTYDPSIDPTMFPGTPAVGYYWSSTPFAGDPGDAWGVYFNNGYAAYNDQTMMFSARCVR